MISSSLWTPYRPENPYPNALYLINEEGDDWYEYQKFFQPDTYKVVFNHTGEISRVTKDATDLFPQNQQIAEVADIPEDFHPYDYRFESGQFIPVEKSMGDIIAANEGVQTKLITQATQVISPLVVLEQSGLLEGSRAVKLEAYRGYLKTLMKVDLSDPTWPEMPA